jgi:hypothetical protein
MPADPLSLATLAVWILLAAILYSSVGHAGASAYLAVMALYGIAPGVMKPAALVMNAVVATAVTWRFARAGLVPWRLLAPLVLGSTPAAFAGGLLQLPTRVHRPLLGAVLLFAAVRLSISAARPAAPRTPPTPPALAAIGAALGLISGLTGVGGGIFLSPLLLLTGWEETRRTAGASGAFILANSVAGLAGHLAGSRGVPAGVLFLTLAALAGGTFGSWLGVRQLSTLALRRLLALVLLIAGVKLLYV